MLAIVRAEDVSGVSLPTPSFKAKVSKIPGGRKTVRAVRMAGKGSAYRKESRRRLENINRIRRDRERFESPVPVEPT